MSVMNRAINEHDIYMINAGLDLNGCKFIGEGRNGKVFLLPDQKVIKICKTKKSCLREYQILERVNGNKYFPRAYHRKGTYMIRDYVGGVTLKQYIKENGLSRALGIKIINLLEEFKKLNFTKIDIRCKDIFVQDDLSLMVIDPKGCFTRRKAYPSHLMKGLKKLGVVGWFKKILCQERADLYREWIINNKLVDEEFGY